MNGIINIYKEAGFTSFDVVAKMRGILKERKIGHTGTLDPDAVGVLPVCVGNATKVVDLLTDYKKEYIASLRLGVETDTQDMTGEILQRSDIIVDEDKIREVIASFVGDNMQIPPMYSALKVNGKKLYELAREGKEVERKARAITLEEIEVLSVDWPIVRMRVLCSKGTYIRTLCHDIGRKLGCFGAMEHLLRSKVGDFTLEKAITLKQLEDLRDAGDLESVVLFPDELFSQYPIGKIKPEFKKLLDNGNTIFPQMLQQEVDLQEGGYMRVYGEGMFYGIFQYHKDENKLKPWKMFFMEAARYKEK